MSENISIFRQYYGNEAFFDRYEKEKKNAVDVIIPVIHTNELWDANLRSIYREIPVSRLLISDGGCIDDSIDLVKKYPRVVVYDHRNFVSLGYCLRKLIESVNTEWFIYLHSDVYLPKGWFDTMEKYQGDYDWFGCPMRITAMVDYYNVNKLYSEVRPYAGSQMGRKSAFVKGIMEIDDDFVYRQEDFVLAQIVETNGFKHGRIEDTYHYHQVMHTESLWSRKINKFEVEIEWSREEQIRSHTMMIKGIVKYLQPRISLRKLLERQINVLMVMGEFNMVEFRNWVKDTNPVWLPHVNYTKITCLYILRRVYNKLKTHPLFSMYK